MQKNCVREVWSAREVAVARAAVRVGRVWQARERTLEVEEKDAVPLSFEAGETRLHGPAPLRCKTTVQRADFLTKALPVGAFRAAAAFVYPDYEFAKL